MALRAALLIAALACAAEASNRGSLAAARGAGFSEAACTDMFSTMVKLGGPVPPADFVRGCTEVCAKVKELKEYWGSGKMADYACEQGRAYGCAWAGTPPSTLQNIGC
mmetsp:Transcript_5257/g.11886  ORF Transcript_5257/g.11886 Transcript_5257/m.11886 type:complete len:108 (-) Transcript_5257:92-415(-)